jgi:hypothetical protein
MTASKIANSGNTTFDNTVQDSHSTLQSEMAAAGTQALKDTAARSHFDRCIAAAIANGCSPSVYIQGRRDVGTKA